MLALTFWKVSLKGKTFTLIEVPPIAVAVIVIIIRVAVAMVVAVVMAVVIAAAAVIAPGKGSGKNPKKSSPWKKGKLPLGLLMQNGTCVGVVSIPIDILPT